MDFVNEWAHYATGLNRYRPFVKARRDAFYEYLPNKDIRDHQVMRRTSTTITDLSELCFHQCVEPEFKYFTHE